MLKQPRDSVINLSNKTFDADLIEILSMGMNTHLRTKFDTKLKKLEIEKFYQGVKNKMERRAVTVEDEDRLKSELKTFGLKKSKQYEKDILSPEDYKKLKQLLKDDDIITRKADKSNVFVIMYKKDYCNKLKTLISDENKFKKIKNNPILDIKRRINSLIDVINRVKDGEKLKKLRTLRSSLRIW